MSTPLRLDPPTPAASHIATGSPLLDTALGGGFLPGALLLVEGEDGAGSTEFALTVLHHRLTASPVANGLFASALRAPTRVQREFVGLFPASKVSDRLRPHLLRPSASADECVSLAESLEAMDVLVIESASALSRHMPGEDLVELLQRLGDLAQARRALILVLHASLALPTPIERGVAEAADGVLSFRWRDGGPMRRRILWVLKLRGLAPVLSNEEVPAFEVGLRRGVGYSVSHIKNVV